MTTVEQSYSSRLYPRLAILAVGLFIVGTNGFMIAGLLPSIASTLGVHASDVSYSITYYAIVVAIAAPAVSVLVPRLSRTTLMALGLALISVGTIVAAAAPTLGAFTLGRIIAALGGAALVPPATAAAAALATPERRGRAIAFVAVGFTAALAFGAPLGTAIAAVGGWRVPLFGLAALAALTAAAVALFVRNIPIGAVVSARRRFAILADSRILLSLLATLVVVSGFNVVYIFSSAVTAVATGGSPSLLALLLLIFGVAGILGNAIAGPLTDRFGNRSVASIILIAMFVSMLALTFVSHSLVGTAIFFAAWGIAANGIALPVQHRLVQVNPETAGVALSWYSTALYAGIALAPPLGAAALRFGQPQLVPIFGAALALAALALFLLGYLPGRAGTPRADAPTVAAELLSADS
jgi:MFS transporter, DHA1 family, inner membrane transport protein